MLVLQQLSNEGLGLYPLVFNLDGCLADSERGKFWLGVFFIMIRRNGVKFAHYQCTSYCIINSS